MLKSDRFILNQRFIELFSLLEAKGLVQKHDRDGKGIGDFAEILLGNRAYGHIIRAFLNPKDRRVIDYHHARTLCEKYGISEQWMFYGKGKPFDLLPTQQTQDVPLPNKILFTSVGAFAGASIGRDTFEREDLQFYSIPGLKGDNLVSFPVEGNSMEPIINDGDIVICQYLERLDQLKENAIYAIKTNGAIWIKYVQKIPNSRGIVTRLRLLSANHLEHDPFEEDINEHTRIYKVIRRISSFD